MNKLTLRFKDKTLNELYNSKNTKQQLQFRILTIVNFGAIITGLSDLCFGDEYTGQLDLSISLFITVFCFIDEIFVCKFRKYTQLGLFLTNCALIFVQLEIQPFYNGFDGYLLGSNQMMVHALILFLLPYYLAFPSNIILASSRLIITYYKTAEITLGVYVYTISVLCFFMVILYQIEKEKKIQFLLHLKDSTLDVIYPKIICKPFYVFTLDKVSMQLNQKLLQQNEFITFSDLINLGLVKSVQLKHYIYQEIKKFSSLQTSHYSHSFNINIEGKRQMGTFSAFKLDQNYFVLTIDSLDRNVQIVENQHQKLQMKQKMNFKMIIKKIGMITHKILIERNLILGSKLRLSMIQLQYYFFSVGNQNLLESFDIKKQLKKLVLFTNELGYKLEIEDNCEIQMFQSRTYFSFFILEILKSINRKQMIKFLLLNKGSIICLEVQGIRRQPQTRVYKKCYGALVSEFEIQIDRLQYTFYKDPLVSFYRIGQLL